MPTKKKIVKSDENVTQGEDPQITGVFQTDFPIYCKSNGLPVISVKILEGTTEPINVTDQSFSVMIKMETSDDPSIKKLEQLIIRGWKVTQPVISSLQLSLKSHLVTTVSLWDTGLNSDLLKKFLDLLPLTQCRHLELGGSPIDNINPVSDLIGACSSLLGLRLRCCEITDDSVMSLSAVLKKNPPLQQLDLSCNKIGDDGVKALSGALRVNNNLLVISLANNDIGDVGAAFLFEALREFQLNHEEIVQRRRVLSQCLQNQSSPGAVLKATSFISKVKRGAEVKKATNSTTTKGKNRSARDDGSATPRDSPSRIVRSQSVTVPVPTGPLIDGVRENGGTIVSCGNFSLISLSLSGNCIGSVVLKSILDTLQYQIQFKQKEEKDFVGKPQPGLMAVFLSGNTFECDNVIYTKICEVLKTRDPMLSMATATSIPEATESTQN